MRNCRTSQKQSQEVIKELEGFVSGLLIELDRQLDKRLVEIFEQALQAILTFRHSLHGLLLSEVDISSTQRKHQQGQND
jgi:hypothetical protein